jgi:hypothetical protein
VAGGSGSRGGDALELLQRREAVEYARLGAWILMVTTACSGRTPSRRIGAAAGASPGCAAGRPARLRGGAQLGTSVGQRDDALGHAVK